MPEIRPGSGLLDTPVLVNPGGCRQLPEMASVSALSLAELAAGPHAAATPDERARRQAHLQVVEATFDALPFDASCARAYGQIFAAVVAVGRKARGRRAVDLLIAATALAHDLPLFTCNADDFDGLEGLVHVIDALAG